MNVPEVNNQALYGFMARYVPQIHCEVLDDVFQAPLSSKKGENGLTAIRVGTEVIRRFFYVPIKVAIVTNNNDKLLELLQTLFYVLKNCVGCRIGKEWIKGATLGFSYGNNKLGKRILTINLSPAFLCPSQARGHCNQCKTCYAMKSEIRHDYELMRNILNFIKILKYDIIDIVNDTLKKIGNGKQAKALNFARFDANGEILDNSVLIKANTLAIALKNKYPHIYSVYTYTHNIDLNLDLATDIVVNQSDKDGEASKATIVLYKWDNKYFDPSKYILCLGNCSYCPYCKNKNDNRTVIFMAHGGGLNAMKTVPDFVLEAYNAMLVLDNEIFMHQCRCEAMAC